MRGGERERATRIALSRHRLVPVLFAPGTDSFALRSPRMQQVAGSRASRLPRTERFGAERGRRTLHRNNETVLL